MRSRVQLSNTNSLVLAGEEDVSTWDDEELAHGRKRDGRGKFSGPTPKVIPRQVLQELQRRSVVRAHAVLAPAGVEAVQVLRGMLADPAVDPSDKIKAAIYLADRALGKEPVRVEAFIEAKIDSVARGMVVDDLSGLDDDIVDADVVEPDSETS